jgi:dGTPase
MEYDYENKLSVMRMRNSTIKRNFVVDEFYSDRSRIIYSSSFRRL